MSAKIIRTTLHRDDGRPPAGRRDLLERIRSEIHRIARAKPKEVARIRRYLSKQLMYDERGTPSQRREKKRLVYDRQKGKCEMCGGPLERRRSELHRTKETWRGYIVSGPHRNTVVVHERCHDRQQEERGYR